MTNANDCQSSTNKLPTSMDDENLEGLEEQRFWDGVNKFEVDWRESGKAWIHSFCAGNGIIRDSLE